MDLQQKNKVVIVTGASRGIGHAIARTFAGEGAKMVLVARSRDALEALAQECEGDSLVHTADLREPNAAAELVAATLRRFERIDTLVNNAGATVRGDFLALDDAQWLDGFSLKFFGAMRCCRAAWQHLIESKGSIINIAGVGARTGSAEFAIGGSVNAAVLNLTKALADRGITDGVRVCAVNPGSIATERLQTRINSVAETQGISAESAAQQMAKRLRVARYGTPEDVAKTVTFLASPAAAYLQGSIIDVDGGQTRTL